MYSLNKAQLIGNITRDPEIRQTPNGQMVGTIGIATNRTWKDTQGNKQDATEFHNVVVWGRLAEICGQYLKKGTKVYFEGRLQTRSWDDESGKKNYRTEIVAENMIMLSGKGDAGGDMSSATSPRAVRNEKASQTADEPEYAEEKISVEDLPF
jgi:single-strand DNA-binding protein